MLNHIIGNLNGKTDSQQNVADETLLSIPAPLRSFLQNNSSNSDKPNTSANATSNVDVETQGRFSNWFSQADTDPLMPKGLSRRQRLLGFLICLVAASLCICLAIVFLPIIMTPAGLRKYVLLHTMGSILLIGSFSFLWGPYNHLKGLFQPEKLPFTFSFSASLVFGLYAVISWQSSILALLALFTQIGLIVWQILSSIPGGRAGLLAFVRGGWWTFKGLARSLPV